MADFILHTKDCGVTLLSNRFIDEYMPAAGGEYVKVYLFLLRRAATSPVRLSVSDIAEQLDHTEKDIRRALRYWEKQNLLSFSVDSDGDLASLTLEDIGSAPEKNMPVQPDSSPAQEVLPVTPASYTPQEVADITAREGLEELFFVISAYLGRPLSQSETSSILYFYDGLGFSAELIEYLFEYCISKNHKNIRYIEKVALSWAEEKITTVRQAQAQAAGSSEDCYSVLRAFGLSGRKPVEKEAAFVETWKNTYGMSMELILEACARTMNAIHNPSFEYTDGILRKWRENGVSSRDDLAALDEAFSSKHQSGSTQGNTFQENTSPGHSSGNYSRRGKNQFHNFEQRNYSEEEDLAYEQLLLTGNPS